jgi:4'-phosphopantetheinyl transferase
MNEFSIDFPENYRNKIKAFRRWQDAQLSLLGRYLLKYGLKSIQKEFYPNNLKFNSNSKPYLDAENLEFNISHSGNIVVCAISDRYEIGIDIEILKDIDIMDFRGQMTQNEWNKVIYSNNISSSFFNYWTQKEAVLKAHGSGIIDVLKSFEIIDNGTKLNKSYFFIKEIFIDYGYKCHMAFKEKMDSNIFEPKYINSLELIEASH